MPIWGLAIAVVMHVAMRSYGVALPIPTWKYYAVATMQVPFFLALFIFAHALVPRMVRLSPRGVGIHNGQAVSLIQGGMLIDWRIRSLPKRPHLAILRLRWRSNQGPELRRTLGIGPKVDLLKLDRNLQMVKRLKWKSRARLNTQRESARRCLQAIV